MIQRLNKKLIWSNMDMLTTTKEMVRSKLFYLGLSRRGRTIGSKIESVILNQAQEDNLD